MTEASNWCASAASSSSSSVRGWRVWTRLGMRVPPWCCVVDGSGKADPHCYSPSDVCCDVSNFSERFGQMHSKATNGPGVHGSSTRRNNTDVIPGQDRFCQTRSVTSRPMSTDWHPWRYAADNHPDLVIDCTKRLPKGVSGLWRGKTIWLCSSLDRAGRRSVLTHEINHVERGVVPPWFMPREERECDRIAAELLISLPSLLDALRWANHEAEVAEVLDVDEHTVRTRLARLAPEDSAWLTFHLDDEEVDDEWA